MIIIIIVSPAFLRGPPKVTPIEHGLESLRIASLLCQVNFQVACVEKPPQLSAFSSISEETYKIDVYEYKQTIQLAN